MSEASDTVRENLTVIRRRILSACERSGRNPADVDLLAVSKFHPPSAIAVAAQLGLTRFGESRVQEAKAKIPLCPSQLEWHLIGHLQSNKARDAVMLFRTIQSVDSLALALELQKHAEKLSRPLRVLLEVNVSGEKSKFGWVPGDLLDKIQAIQALARLEIQGLMTLAPFTNDLETVRPVFRRLRELRDRCAERIGAPLPVLSMGMSGDLEVAIEEGATLVRVGTALFGVRPTIARTDSVSGVVEPHR